MDIFNSINCDFLLIFIILNIYKMFSYHFPTDIDVVNAFLECSGAFIENLEFGLYFTSRRTGGNRF